MQRLMELSEMVGFNRLSPYFDAKQAGTMSDAVKTTSVKKTRTRKLDANKGVFAENLLWEMVNYLPKGSDKRGITRDDLLAAMTKSDCGISVQTFTKYTKGKQDAVGPRLLFLGTFFGFQPAESILSAGHIERRTPAVFGHLPKAPESNEVSETVNTTADHSWAKQSLAEDWLECVVISEKAKPEQVLASLKSLLTDPKTSPYLRMAATFLVRHLSKNEAA